MAECKITLTLTRAERDALARALAQISRSITIGKQPIFDDRDYDALGKINASLNA